MVFIRFGGAEPKRTLLRVLDMKYYILFYFYSSFRTFFHVSGFGFFRIGSGFLAYPDPDTEKKSDPDPVKKNLVRNTGCCHYCKLTKSEISFVTLALEDESIILTPHLL